MVSKRQAWKSDQMLKSIFFQQKLHAWGLIETAERIESISGENLEWSLDDLKISQKAWNKIIHNGIKPILVFAHPDVLTATRKSVSYYRMLAMVSQKSMNQVGLRIIKVEQSNQLPNQDFAKRIASHLNQIISNLIEAESKINNRGFDIWRGMAAGSQAQGSWQNTKGNRAELAIRSRLILRLDEQNLIDDDDDDVDVSQRVVKLDLYDGRRVFMGDEPDIAIYTANRIDVAVEIKGGIDIAGVLERVGAALKSLRRAKEENPESVTILILQAVSLSEQAKRDIQTSQDIVNYWFTIEDLLEDTSQQDLFFSLLKIE